MADLTDDIASIRAFVPARDYPTSQAFYEALGAAPLFKSPEISGYRWGQASFLLQNFYVEALAANFMMQLRVADPDAWWARIEALDLVARFGVRAPMAPTDRPWGRVLTLFDPAGVLWQITRN